MSIEIIATQKGAKYRAVVHRNGKRHRSALFERKTDACLWEEKVKSGFQIGSMPTFGAAAHEWHETHCRLHCKPSTIAKNEALFKDILPIIGKRQIGEVKTKDVENLLLKLKERGLSNGSLNQRICLIKSVYNWHIKRGLNVYNPTLAIPKLKSTDTVLKHWSRDHIDLFLTHTETRYANTKQSWVHGLYLVAINTGLRWGEILGLDWSAIDLSQQLIRIDQIFDGTTETIRPTTKSGRIRYVGINESLLGVFQSLGPKSSGLVFTNLVGKVVDRRNFMIRHFEKDVKDSGVPRISFHGLRHTFATLFMQNGGNIYDLQKLLGHSCLAMTEVYAHFSPDHATKRAHIVNIGGRFGNVIEGKFRSKQTAEWAG